MSSREITADPRQREGIHEVTVAEAYDIITCHIENMHTGQFENSLMPYLVQRVPPDDEQNWLSPFTNRNDAMFLVRTYVEHPRFEQEHWPMRIYNRHLHHVAGLGNYDNADVVNYMRTLASGRHLTEALLSMIMKRQVLVTVGGTDGP